MRKGYAVILTEAALQFPDRVHKVVLNLGARPAWMDIDVLHPHFIHGLPGGRMMWYTHDAVVRVRGTRRQHDRHHRRAAGGLERRRRSLLVNSSPVVTLLGGLSRP